MSGSIHERLEMILVMRWLDDGAPSEGALAIEVDDAAEELGLEADRQGVLAVMAALGALEERGVISVHWPRGTSPEARVTLSRAMQRDARRLFGRGAPPPEG